MTPADLVLLCGVLGNITEGDIERTAAYCAQLCRTGGTLVWTRNRRPPDLVPQICDCLESHGFERQSLSDPGTGHAVGVHRFAAESHPLQRGTRMFTFIGYDTLRRT